MCLASGMTDIDDKIINRAAASKVDYLDLAREKEADFVEDMVALGVRQPAVYLRVSEHMPEIIAYIASIQSRGLAYETDEGSEGGESSRNVYVDMPLIPCASSPIFNIFALHPGILTCGNSTALMGTRTGNSSQDQAWRVPRTQTKERMPLYRSFPLPSLKPCPRYSKILLGDACHRLGKGRQRTLLCGRKRWPVSPRGPLPGAMAGQDGTSNALLWRASHLGRSLACTPAAWTCAFRTTAMKLRSARRTLAAIRGLAIGYTPAISTSRAARCQNR